MNFLRDQSPAPADTLIVLLPGAYTTPVDFVAAGFIDALRERQLPIDVAIAELDLATVSDGSCLPVIRTEAILPAKGAAYRHIWLGGISLGGYLSLSYAERYRGEVDALCLLAPYPGNRMTTNEIEAAGGLAGWQPRPESLSDPEFRTWNWLKTCATKPPVFMGYGTEDRFAKGMALLASGLQPEQVRTIAGGHDWPTWRSLWDDFVNNHLRPSI